MAGKNVNGKFYYVASVFLIYLYFLDTGGWIGLRLAVLLCMLAMTFLVTIRIRIPVNLLWLLFISLIAPSMFVSSITNISFEDSLKYIYPIIVFPLYFYIADNLKITPCHLIDVGGLFALTVIILFAAYYCNVPFAMEIMEYLSNTPDAGFFKEKSTFVDGVIHNIYFKATLLLVPIGVLAVGYKKYAISCLVIVALIIAQSKAGIVVLFIFSAWTVLGNRLFNIPFISFASAIGVLVFNYVSNVDALRDDLLTGSSVRLLHIDSVFKQYSNDWYYLFTGFGPGSEFYSEGFGGFTDDNEISQLEMLRRYGVGFTILFITVYFSIVKKCFRQGKYIEGKSFLSYFIICATNPVLLSAPALFFYAIFISFVMRSDTEIGFRSCKKLDV